MVRELACCFERQKSIHTKSSPCHCLTVSSIQPKIFFPVWHNLLTIIHQCLFLPLHNRPLTALYQFFLYVRGTYLSLLIKYILTYDKIAPPKVCSPYLRKIDRCDSCLGQLLWKPVWKRFVTNYRTGSWIRKQNRGAQFPSASPEWYCFSCDGLFGRGRLWV